MNQVVRSAQHVVRFPYEYGLARTIPQQWQAKRLDEFADITSGITLNQDREAASNGVRYLTVVNVYRGHIDLTEERHLELRGNEAETKMLRPSDILVVEGHANPAEIGRAALVGQREAGMSFQNHLFRIRLENEDEVRARFLVRALNSERVRRHWVATSKTSSGLSTINRTALRQLVIPVPNPDEQTRIAETLKAADDHIRALEEQIRKAERVKKALLQSVFIEGIPGRGQAPQTFRWGMAPDGWNETTIRSIVTEPVGNGTSPDAARQEPPGFPTLNVSSIRNGRCDQTKISYIELPEKAAADFVVAQGDFFVLRGNGNRDFVAIGGLLIEEPQTGLVFSDLLIRLRFDKSKALPAFMKYLWQSPQFLRRLQSYAVTGSGLWKIGQRPISRLKLAVPPDTGEQKDIAAIFDAQEELLLSLGVQLTVARRVKQSLLQNLLTGKIRLKP